MDGTCLEIEEGKFTAIVGTSGSGKSTLLYMLGGLDTLTYGRVIVGGKDISKMKPDAQLFHFIYHCTFGEFDHVYGTVYDGGAKIL